MSVIALSIDTETRQIAMTINGAIAPVDSVYLSKSQDYDGKPYLRFEYTTRSTNSNGLEEIHGYFLPQPDDSDASAQANEHRFVERPVVNAAKAVADIQAFFAKSKCQDRASCMPDKHADNPGMRQMQDQHQKNMQEDNAGCTKPGVMDEASCKGK